MTLKTPIYKYELVIKLDKKDKKILYELSKNARQAVTSIAKKVGLSNDAVKYRINRLNKKGYLYGFSAVVNFNRLGYSWFIVLIKLRYFEKEIEDKLKEFFLKKDSILKVMKLSGNWNIQFDIVVKNLSELTKLIAELKENFDLVDIIVLNSIKEYKYTHTPVDFFKELVKPEDIFPVGRTDETEKITKRIDKKDLEIIKLLIKNARTSLLIISKKINLSMDATSNRIKKLEKNNVIRGYMPMTNPPLLGYDQHWIFVQLKKIKKEFISYLMSHPNIQCLVRTGFKYDFLFWIASKSIGEYNEILDQILAKFADIILNYDSMLALEEYKYTEFPGVVSVW